MNTNLDILTQEYLDNSDISQIIADNDTITISKDSFDTLIRRVFKDGYYAGTNDKLPGLLSEYRLLNNRDAQMVISLRNVETKEQVESIFNANSIFEYTEKSRLLKLTMNADQYFDVPTQPEQEYLVLLAMFMSFNWKYCIETEVILNGY